MQIQLIRNATLRLTYHGHTFLIDPMLGPKHSYQSLAGIEENPTVGLTIPFEEVIAGVERVIISHLHNDHFDGTAKTDLPKSLPILCQPGDAARISEHGFTDVSELAERTIWQGITITRTGGQHGTGAWAERLNPVSGFVFQAEDEPTLYWCGDTIWCSEVEDALTHQPDVIITHSGGAELEDSGPILMDAAQTIQTAQAAPAAVVVAVHMEALDHCKTTRADLAAAIEAQGIDPERLLIPADGESIEIS